MTMRSAIAESPLPALPSSLPPRGSRPAPSTLPIRQRKATFTARDVSFTVDEQYTLRRFVGRGAFGTVVAVNDGSSLFHPAALAIKKIPDVLRHPLVTLAAGLIQTHPSAPAQCTRCFTALARPQFVRSNCFDFYARTLTCSASTT